MLGFLHRRTSILISSYSPKHHLSNNVSLQNVVTIIKGTRFKFNKYSTPTFSGCSETVPVSEASLREGAMPKHVTVILDGNRRWHEAHGKVLSYVPFFHSNMLLVDLCLKWKIPTASSFVYGLVTLGRAKEANDLLFGQFETWLNDILEVFTRKGVRVCITGETSILEESLQRTIKDVEDATRNNTNLEFILGVCYTGRIDIVQATKTICKKVRAGKIDPNTIDESMIETHLSTRIMSNPNPDLLIRTGGTFLLRNYFMRQLANTELYFTNVYAPEFSEREFIQALRFFQTTERAFDK